MGTARACVQWCRQKKEAQSDVVESEQKERNNRRHFSLLRKEVSSRKTNSIREKESGKEASFGPHVDQFVVVDDGVRTETESATLHSQQATTSFAQKKMVQREKENLRNRGIKAENNNEKWNLNRRTNGLMEADRGIDAMNLNYGIALSNLDDFCRK